MEGDNNIKTVCISIITCPLKLVIGVFMGAIFLLVMCIWMVLTLTGIGPMVQYHFRCEDERILDREHILHTYKDMKAVSIPAGTNSAHPEAYTVIARYTEPSERKYKNPVVIPNGFGSYNTSCSLFIQTCDDIVTCRCYVGNYCYNA